MVNKTVVSSPDHFLGLAPWGRLVKAERVADEKAQASGDVQFYSGWMLL